jgi:hypothetical protein
MDHVQELAECFGSLTVLDMKPLKDQFWAHMMSCIKMPRGGLNGGGSMHSSFEMVVPNEICIQYLMEDLPLEQNKRYNLSLPLPTGKTLRQSRHTTRSACILSTVGCACIAAALLANSERIEVPLWQHHQTRTRRALLFSPFVHRC